MSGTGIDIRVPAYTYKLVYTYRRCMYIAYPAFNGGTRLGSSFYAVHFGLSTERTSKNKNGESA